MVPPRGLLASAGSLSMGCCRGGGGGEGQAGWKWCGCCPGGKSCSPGLLFRRLPGCRQKEICHLGFFPIFTSPHLTYRVPLAVSQPLPPTAVLFMLL